MHTAFSLLSPVCLHVLSPVPATPAPCRTPRDHSKPPLPRAPSKAKQPHFNPPAFLNIQTPADATGRASGKGLELQEGKETGWIREPQTCTSPPLPRHPSLLGVQR